MKLEKLAREVDRAIRDVGLSAPSLNPMELERLGQEAGAFFSQPIRNMAWESIRGGMSIQDPDGWQSVREITFQPVILWLGPASQAAWRFDSGEDLARVLGETYHFEFFVVNEECTFLLCFNHHDFLIGAGSAEVWLTALNAEASPRIPFDNGT